VLNSLGIAPIACKLSSGPGALIYRFAICPISIRTERVRKQSPDKKGALDRTPSHPLPWKGQPIYGAMTMETTQQQPPPDPGVEYVVAAILTVAAVGTTPHGMLNTKVVMDRYTEVLQALRGSGLLTRP
jgi:hypothetical protein